MIITRFRYTGDDGINYRIRRKQTKGQAVSSDAQLLQQFVLDDAQLLSTIKVRFARATLVTDPNVKGVFTVGTRELLAQMRNVPQILEVDEFGQELTWNVTSLTGENERVPFTFDSGQTDGDQP